MIDQTLSHFRITAKLGEGGMGEVYRAEDTKLGREVAIKVLPEAFTAEPERLARFEREARVLASLNHPHVAAIYSIESAETAGTQAGRFKDTGVVRFLVMELVEGEDLASRLGRGAVPLEETIAIGLQIAEALESAHERGIVHRDLKPANIKLTPDGQVKVLDFGLAKALEGPAGMGGAASLSISPTLTAGMTATGVLLGTAAYMSPEQAKGLETDRRSDVWAFGVVLWEMLTGRRLFAGDSVSDTLAAVLRDEISAERLPAGTPPSLQALLGRCLDRDPRSRLRDIGEARVALAALASGEPISTLVGIAAPPAKEARSAKRATAGWMVAAVAIVVSLLLGLLALWPREEPIPLIYSSLVPPAGAGFDVGNGLALSPDGAALVFSAIDSERQSALWVLSFASGEARRLSGTEGASYPFWSPDGRHLGFMSQGSLKRVAATGGPMQSLAPVREGRGGAWGPDGTIVFAPDFRGGLSRVPAAGGKPVELTRVDLERREQAHRFPVFLPDGKRVLFLSQTAEGGSQIDDSRIEVVDLASGERSAVVTANSSMAYAPSGHLLFWLDGTLMAAELDLATATLRSEPVPVAERIGYTGNEFATFSVSGTGLLVYQAGSLYESYTSLVTLDAAGQEVSPESSSDYHQRLRLSGDGSRAAYRGPDNRTIWIRDLERQTKTRFTFEDGDHLDPIWSPDDRWIAYLKTSGHKFQVFRKPASGLDSAELLFETDLQVSLQDWSADGRYLSVDVLDNTTDTDKDVALYDLQEGNLEILVQSPFFDSQGRFSPDGRWIAYASDDSGQLEIFVVPAARRGGRFQISTAGGLHPEWDPSGKKLYYVNPLVELMVVDIDLDQGVDIGQPQRLFDIRHEYNQDPPFQVMPDGRSFLVAQVEQEIRGGNLTLVQTWTELLSRR